MTGGDVFKAAGSASASGAERVRALPRAEVAGPRLAGADRTSVRDLRGGRLGPDAELRWPAGDRLVVSGLPGSGKSTLMRRVVAASAGAAVQRIDSQDTRERWATYLPDWLPYAVYRPLVRIAHYRSLWRALRSPHSVLVHDCGRSAWVRRWIARHSRRHGRALHLLLLDVEPHVALAGQRERGRTVSRYAFARHRRATAALLAGVEARRPPVGCATVTLLDAATAAALPRIGFTDPPPAQAAVPVVPAARSPRSDG